jgi:hypothetical protein
VAALPYYLTLTQTWIYHPIDGQSLIYQFGLLPQVAWSISTEWFFYLAFPLICFVVVAVRSTESRMVCAGLFTASALIIITLLNLNVDAIQQLGVTRFGPVAAETQDSFARWLLYFSPYIRIFEFILGCLCASVYLALAHRSPSESEQRWGLWLTGAALLAIAAMHWLMFGVNGPPWWPLVVPPLHMNFGFAPFIAILIFCCARYQNAFVRLMSRRSVVLCGEASYSLYLLHFLIIGAFHYEAAPISSWQVATGAVARLGVVIMAAIGLSLVTWSIIEVPARAWIIRLLQKRYFTQDVVAIEARTPAE